LSLPNPWPGRPSSPDLRQVGFSSILARSTKLHVDPAHHHRQEEGKEGRWDPVCVEGHRAERPLPGSEVLPIRPHSCTPRAPSTDPTVGALPTTTASVALASVVPSGRERAHIRKRERQWIWERGVRERVPLGWGRGRRSAAAEGGEVKQQTLSSYIYIEDGYRASTGPVRPWPFLEARFIVCPPPWMDLWRRTT
jgi:hypothetical protein